LRTLQHFERGIGQTAQVKTDAIDGRSNWTGSIAGIDGDKVLLEVDGERVALRIDNIKKAHIKGNVDFGKKESR
jgi:ribosome maturation factor RimP